MLRFDLPSHLPLFAVSGAVLLPRGRIPMTVYEPRYLQMIDDVLKTPERMIGVIQPRGASYANIGGAGRLVGFQEMDDGRMMISLKAVSRFRLRETEGGFTPYARGRVDWTGFGEDHSATPQEDPEFDRAHFLAGLDRYLEAQGLSTDWESLDEAGDELLINALCMALPFSSEEKQALLEAVSLGNRRELLAGLMEFATHQGGNSDEVLQ